MGTRVTIQDIADELGISRNTVSKAINNTGILADATRDKVLKKAMEMDYKQFSYVTIYGTAKPKTVLPLETEKQQISLFTSNFISSQISRLRAFCPCAKEKNGNRSISY